MALSKTSQTPQASATNTAGSTTTGSSLATNYGVSGVATITNGGTGPTVACSFSIYVSNDGGTTWFLWSTQTAGVVASTTYTFPFALSIGGGADFGNYQTVFSGNTAQSVTVATSAETTATI